MSDQGSKMEAQIIVENPEGQLKSADQPDEIADVVGEIELVAVQARRQQRRTGGRRERIAGLLCVSTTEETVACLEDHAVGK